MTTTLPRGRGLRVGIDACRNRSGGAIAHLVGILSELDPAAHGIAEVHLWSYRDLLSRVPDRPWLVKHAPPALDRSLPHQLWWQARRLHGELAAQGCDILYTTDAATVCRYRPMVVFSQDLLSYEPGALRELGVGYASARVAAILLVQNRAFRRADGVVFLTRYAGERIQASCGPLRRVTYIPHGVGEAFRATARRAPWPAATSEPVRCVYVSPILGYKHQWNVVAAVELLRRRGHNVTLTLVGSGTGKAAERLARQIEASDPGREFVVTVGHVPQADLPTLLSGFHLFLFASSCEAFGITLLEGMTLGLPIVSSDRSSLPETLRDGGIYCDPLDPASIAASTEALLGDAALRQRVGDRARELSQQYSWRRCAEETFAFIAATVT
jgi:glycosyltransferase involved in cell wall biosynthesis